MSVYKDIFSKNVQLRKPKRNILNQSDVWSSTKKLAKASGDVVFNENSQYKI